MRIFLSYASEDRGVAERVAAALQAADHSVFFDKQGLRGGDAFHERLREEVRRADVFVCLVSRHAVAEDSYVRTELQVAGERWRNPSNRIIPALLEEIAIERLPVVLQPLHVLPAGPDPIAPILTAIAAARRKRSAERRRRVVVAASIVAAIVGAYFLVRWLVPGRMTVAVTALDLDRPGVDPWPDTLSAHGWIDNGTRIKTTLRSWSVETKPADIGLLLDGASVEELTVAPGDREAWDLELELATEATRRPDFEWRLCGSATTGQVCSPWRSWSPERSKRALEAFSLPADLHRRVRAVASAPNVGFVLAASDPNELLWLSENGDVTRKAGVDGEPVTVFAAAGEVLVATRDPDSIQAWTLSSGESLWTAPFPSLTIQHEDWEERASTRIRDLVATPTRVWVATGAEQGSAVLAAYDRSSRQWSIPKFYDDFDFNAELLRMVVSGERVWAGNEGVTPASVHVWTDDATVKLSGHDIDAVSCADDVAPGSVAGAVLRTCTGDLLEVDEQDGRLRTVRRLGRMVGENEDTEDPTVWMTSRIASSQSGFALGLTKGNVGAGATVEGEVVWMPRGGEARTLFRLPTTKVLDVALTADTLLVLLESPRRRGLVLLRLA